jgi:hypothetical protein
MSAIDFVLLGFAVALQIVFFGTLVFLRVTRPIEKRADGGRYITNEKKYQEWLKTAERAEKLLKPALLHSISGGALVCWLIYRTVLSFM